MDGVPVFPKLFPLQLARVSCRGPYQLRAPVAAADGVLDVLLRDLGIRSARRPNRVWVDFRRADAVGLGRGHTRPEHADSGCKNGEKDLRFHLTAFLEGKQGQVSSRKRNEWLHAPPKR
jgi:hypothetical protein